jgi:hypothetical protein
MRAEVRSGVKTERKANEIDDWRRFPDLSCKGGAFVRPIGKIAMASDTNPIVTKPWYHRPGGIFRLLVVVLALVFVVWRVHLSFSVKARLAALKRAGHPITLAELARLRYPPIADETNAAAFFNKAIDLSHFTNSTSRKLFDEFRPRGRFITSTQFFSGEYQEKLTQLLDENREAVDWLHKSPPGKQSRYELTFDLGYKMPLPHLAPLASAVLLLSMQAAQHADQNQMDAAMADLEAAFRILDSLADEPILISHLVRMRCRKQIFDGVELILARRSFTEEQLVELSSAFRQREFPGSLARAWEGELCFGNQVFQMHPEKLLALAREKDEPVPSSFKRKEQGFGANVVMNWSGFTPRDFNFFLGAMSERLAAAKIPFPEGLQVDEELDRRVTRESQKYVYFYSSLMLPALGKAYLREAEDLAHSDIIQTVLAVERFRLAHKNQLPDPLGELTPVLLPSVPIDPFTGRKLNYKKLPSGYVVYSVGRNRMDDGGLRKTSNKPEGPDDITFVVER